MSTDNELHRLIESELLNDDRLSRNRFALFRCPRNRDLGRQRAAEDIARAARGVRQVENLPVNREPKIADMSFLESSPIVPALRRPS